MKCLEENFLSLWDGVKEEVEVFRIGEIIRGGQKAL
jgi:hypothetical protein